MMPTLPHSSIQHRVVIGVYAWNLTGINVFAANLARGLLRRGVEVEILATEHDTELVQLPRDMMPVPKDVPFVELPVSRTANWAERWLAMIRYLEDRGPCIYLPTSDYRQSCVTPKLSSNVIVVGTIQGDDPVHYEHVQRLGAWWDGIVGVSDECARRIRELDASFAERTFAIPNGVPVPEDYQREVAETPLRVVYHGVLNTVQKRILDIPKIVAATRERNLPVTFTIAGDGPQAEELQAACQEYVDQGLVQFLGLVPNENVKQLLSEHDVYLMTSAFEGMPHAMLEAMALGCVPLVTNIRSGIPEVIRDGQNGVLVEIGDIEGFADGLESLCNDASMRDRIGREAYQTVREGPYNAEHMVDAYLDLFRKAATRVEQGAYQRPAGSILPPPAHVGEISIFPVDHADHVKDAEEALRDARPTPRKKGWAERLLRFVGSRLGVK